MASFVMKCPFCAGEMTVQSEWCGRTMACAHCGVMFIVPPDPASGQVPPNFSAPFASCVEPLRPAGLTADFLRKLYRNWWLFLVIGLVVTLVVGIAGTGVFLSSILPTQSNAADAGTLVLSVVIFMLFILLVFLIFSAVSAISFYRLVYNLWKIVPPEIAETTPGMAVGLLFIPFFNLYWIFVAYGGLARAYNRMSGGRIPDLESFVRTGNVFEVLTWIPYLGGICSLVSFILQLLFMKRFVDTASAWLPEK